MDRNTKKQKGTTLLEILLYFTIVGAILFAAISFSIQTLTITKESENIHEIYSNIDLISKRITNTIKEAESIDDANSIFDNDQGAISLNVSVALNCPTKIYWSENGVYLKQGALDATKISSDAIECTKLRFQKIEYEKTPDQVVIEAEFNSVNGSINNLEQSMKFRTAVSIRKL
jgi:Tfp pilus assembly protein PilV